MITNSARLVVLRFVLGAWSAIAQAAPSRIHENTVFKTFRLHVPATPAADFDITVTVNNTDQQLHLRRHSLRSDRFRVRAQLADGQWREVSPPPCVTYRGTVDGHANSIVAASLHGGVLRAIVAFDGTPAWAVQPITDLDPTAESALYAAYHIADVPAGPWRCGNDPQEEIVNPAASPSPQAFPRGGGCNRLCRIAFDADLEFHQQNGSSEEATVADIEMVLNATDAIFLRDAGIRYQLTEVLIRTAEPDPYTTTNYSTLLSQFGTDWNQNHADVDRDVAHLMTGRDLDTNVIGVAHLAAICRLESAYALSQSHFTTYLSSRVGLTAHELGHNWAAGHCDSQPPCYIMCSTLGGCSSDLSRFSLRSSEAMVNFRNQLTCLEPGDPMTDPAPPRAFTDTAVVAQGESTTVNALANDIDANCDSLTIMQFQAESQLGGQIERVAAGGGDPDQLLYSAPLAASGEDSFSYTIRDASGLNATGAVRVTVLPLRQADHPAFTRPGLQVSYYDSSIRAIPDFSRMQSYYTVATPNINFPIGQWGRGEGPNGGGSPGGTQGMVYFGAVIRGAIHIPQPGLYQFYTESDDGSKLYIDDGLVVNNDGLHDMEERSGSIDLSAGDHTIRVDYFDGNGDAGLIARIEGGGLDKQVIPPEMFSSLMVSYYNLWPPAGLPNFSLIAPYKTSSVPRVEYPLTPGNFAESGLAERMAALFTGYLTVPASGSYRIYMQADDGAILYIGDQRVVAASYWQFTEQNGIIGLAAGAHAVRVEYFENNNDAGLILRISGGGLDKRIIPTEMWSHVIIPGDLDCDGTTNAADVEAFALALADPAAYAAAHPTCNIRGADVNNDGNLDGADIAALVAAVLSP